VDDDKQGELKTEFKWEIETYMRGAIPLVAQNATIHGSLSSEMSMMTTVFPLSSPYGMLLVCLTLIDRPATSSSMTLRMASSHSSRCCRMSGTYAHKY